MRRRVHCPRGIVGVCVARMAGIRKGVRIRGPRAGMAQYDGARSGDAKSTCRITMQKLHGSAQLGRGNGVLPVQLYGYFLRVYLNFCPPMLASYIRPPLATVKVAMPLL